MDACEMPLMTLAQLEYVLLILTRCVLLSKYALIILIISSLML